MRKMLIAGLLMSALLFGCTDAQKSQISALGSRFKVTQFSGGKVVGEWESTGKVSTEPQSDGYYFTDKMTGKLIRVSGTIQVLQVD